MPPSPHRTAPPGRGAPPYERAIEGARNLELDDALLRVGLPSVRAAVLDSDSVSLGVAQPEDDPTAVRAAALGIPVLRRASGGTGLLHGAGDLTWSIVLPRDDPRAGRDFTSAYPRLGAGVVGRLRELGLDSEWSEPFGISERFCLLGSRGRVLTVGGRAIGGAAQHVTSSALLHQGTVSYRVDRPLLARLFDLAEPTLDTSVTSLVDEGVTTAPPTLRDGLLTHLRAPPGPLQRASVR